MTKKNMTIEETYTLASQNNIKNKYQIFIQFQKHG